MSRRILLIDADKAFRDTLTQQIGRYRVVVMTEPDPERGLALAASDPPDLLIIAVEEPDKAGFKTFQKARKQLPAKLPVVLVTKSMSKDSFTKHRSLKIHADEYIDKRGLTKDELIGKVDNLIGLGDLQEDEVSIPVEDEIPMEIADGDVVLDEQLEDDPVGEFGNPHEIATVGGNNQMLVDSMVSKELDGAFDSMLADDVPLGISGIESDPEPITAIAGAIEVPDQVAESDSVPEPVPEPVDAAADDSGIPEPVPHKIADDEEPVPQKGDFEIEGSIPERIMDGGRSTGGYESVAAQLAAKSDEPDVDDLPAAPSADDEPLAPVVVDEEAGHEVSESSIPIDDDDLVSLDDDAIEEIDEPSPEPFEEAKVEPPMSLPPVREPSAPMSMPMPIVAEHARAKRATGSQASIDLGLDKLAQDAESEQSGVYDRKSLRKIGELERQISQLKTELERTRTAADQAAKGGGRESQFLNLRESNLAKEKELKQVKTSLEQHSKDLAESQEKLRQALQAKSALEAKNAEIEQQLAEDGAKVKELATSLREATSQASQLEIELEAKTKAAAGAEAKVAQFEKDLANERATGAASASEAERKLRNERDQMLIRHKGELAAQKAEVEAQQELNMGRMREELDAERAAAVEEAIEETRRANAAEHGEVVSKIEHKHNAELIQIKSEHAGELSRTKNELGGEIERLNGEVAEAHASRVAALAAVNEENESHIAGLQQERDAAVAAAQQERDIGIATAHRERDTAIASANARSQAEIAAAHEQREVEVASVEQSKAEALAAAEMQRMQDIDRLRAQHQADVEAREEEHQDVLERDAQAHGQALKQLKQELDRAIASHEIKLASVRHDNEVLIANHQREKAELAHSHDLAIAALKEAQEQELELMADGARRATEKHRQDMADMQARYEHQISELQTNAAREIGELAAQLQATRKAAEEAAVRHQAEHDEATRLHAEQIDALEAKHERAIAVANGEYLKAKAVADAEHKQAIASLKSEADRMLRQLEEERTAAIHQLEAEREELRKGLSGTRDSLKRTEGELASAVNTIADRNADLRAHAQAIAERDQRIAQLRAELESLEQENANYQEQVLRAYQKIKSDEAMVARARKAMAIALTVLDDEGNPQSSSS